MEAYLPFFPLKLVAYPGEQLNLHIFEPRYKQLINECVNADSSFGIPVFHNKVLDYGSEMKVMKVVNRYSEGELDIVTKCFRIFKIHSFETRVDARLYSGGEVSYLENDMDASELEWLQLISLSTKLFELLKFDEQPDFSGVSNTFELAHKVGLSIEQQYELMQLTKESQRIKYLCNHMERTIPVIEEMERTKEKIKMNGHFQHLDPLNF